MRAPPARLRLEPLAESSYAEYQAFVEQHPQATLFHILPWLEFIRREQNARIVVCRVLVGDTPAGFWPFATTRVGPFRLLGSPLRGWLTMRMGPLTTVELQAEEVPQAVRGLARQLGAAYVELAGAALQEPVFAAAGYDVRRRETWLLDLAGDDDRQWKLLEHSCRKNVKAAERGGVTVRALEGPEYLDRLYALVRTTYTSKGMRVPFAERRLQLLWETIGAAGQWLSLGAFHEDRFVGGHIWGMDKRCAYALVAASELETRPLRVNNALIWEGIRAFNRRGLAQYDMYGGGSKDHGVARFKASFGATFTSYPHFARSRSPLFSAARHAYESWYLKLVHHPKHT